MLIYTVYNDLNKYSICIPIKYHKTAICSHHCTVASQDFVSMALLQYSAHLYSAIFCTAIVVYSMVVSPNTHTL